MIKNKNKDKYFVPNGFGIYQILRNYDAELIDYNKKKSNINSTEFRELLRLCKELSSATNPRRYELKDAVSGKRNLFFNAEYIGNPGFAKADYSEISDIVKDDLVVVPTPTFTGKLCDYVILSDCIGVNSKCKNKEAAFNFIKIAVSFEMQKRFDSKGKINYCIEAPVNKKAYSDDLLSYQSSNLLPKDFNDSLMKNYSIQKVDQIKEYSIYEMIANISDEYIKGNKSMDQVIKEIDDNVNVFLNE